MGRHLPQPWRLKCRPTSVGAPLPAKRPPGLTELKIRSRRRYRAAIMVNARLSIYRPRLGAASFPPLPPPGVHIADAPRISTAPAALRPPPRDTTPSILFLHHI